MNQNLVCGVINSAHGKVGKLEISDTKTPVRLEPLPEKLVAVTTPVIFNPEVVKVVAVMIPVTFNPAVRLGAFTPSSPTMLFTRISDIF